MKALIKIKNLCKHFEQKQHALLKAVDDVSFDIYPQETLGLVGESGCGKSTLARVLLKLIPASSGSVFFEDQDLFALKNLKAMRKKMQIVFQDPEACLNPRMTVEEIVGEGIAIHKLAFGKQKKERIVELLETVGLKSEHLRRYPHEFSGGQRQRIGIARALAVEPSFLICDEVLSALDISIQAQIVLLLEKLQRQMGLTYLFIAHDLRMVRQVCQRVAVMYQGRIVEIGPTEELFQHPQHPYTKKLFSLYTHA